MSLRFERACRLIFPPFGHSRPLIKAETLVIQLRIRSEVNTRVSSRRLHALYK